MLRKHALFGALSIVSVTLSMARAEAQDPATLIVGVSPSAISVPIYLAQQQGLFAAHGLQVEIVTIQSGAEAVPRLLNGSFDVSLGDAVGTITAMGNHVPIRIVGVNTVGATVDGRDNSGLVARPGTVTGFGDLAGHTVAVNQASGMAAMVTMAAVDAAGGISADVQFVELPFPQMIEAVAQGRVDSALLVEPFVTAAAAGGLSIAGRPMAMAIPGFPANIYIASQQGVDTHGTAIASFIEAVTEAGRLAEADQALAREVTASYSPIPRPMIDAMNLPTFPEDAADFSAVGQLVDMMVSYHIIDHAPAVADLVWSAAN